MAVTAHNTEQLFATGWSAVPAGHHAPTHEHEQCQSGASTPTRDEAGGAAAPPPALVAAFLKSHAVASAAPDASDARPSALQSSASLNSELDGELPLLHNPFAAAAAAAAAASTEQGSCRQQQQPRHSTKLRQQRPPLLRRLVRGLLVTAAAGGLVALGAWGGTAAYRHYMAQLDDRDKLARRVAELHRQEEKLLLRCTATEQHRAAISDQLAVAQRALVDSESACKAQQRQSRQAAAEREEAVRLNLSLQRKLAGLEDSHTALTASSKDAAAALQAAQADAAKLSKEVSRLEGTVERLESRCGVLEAEAAELLQENAAVAAAGEQHRAKGHA